MATSFPRQHARTNRFTLGVPRAFAVAPDGSRVAFLRSASGTDRSHRLWVCDLAGGPRQPGAAREYVAADPEALLGGAEEELSAEERARRERSRESSAGIVGYATDKAVELAAFALSGRLFTARLDSAATAELPAPGPVLDPRPSPDGSLIAYVVGGALRVIGADGADDRVLAEPEADTVAYGLAEFIAAEEMQRHRGFWWSPDSGRLLAARSDDAPVERWWIADPAHPDRRPTEVAYPAAGTANAEVTLHLFTLADGSRREIEWDRGRYPYLARVHWSAGGPPLLLVQARDQRSQLYLAVDPETGATAPVHTEEDPRWLELFTGVPAWTPDGRLVRIEDRDGDRARVLCVDDRALTDGSLQVRRVLDVGPYDVLVMASPGAGSWAAGGTGEGPDDAVPKAAPHGAGPVGDIGVYRVPLDGGGCERLGGEPELAAEPGAGPGSEVAPHVASAVRGGDTLVLTTSVLGRPGSRATVLRLSGGEGGATGRTSPLAVIPSLAEEPLVRTAPQLLRTGEHGIPAAVVLPTGYREGDGPLPVLMDPYGGPHGQCVQAAHNAYLTSQWFADQGFAVVVADGRGTPGSSPAWEKAIHHDLARVVLDDQVEALRSLADTHPLDLSRVGIRGWSFGGYLAALAVLRRPDVFHAAVSGAPVTDLRLYDTHYQERYCGTPQDDPEVYAASSLITDEGLSGARSPHRPLMLIHGLADDNVAVAHTLRLSSALLAAGRPHEVLPLSGVTHMASQEEVAENLLQLQVAFLKRTLGVA